MDTEAAPAIWEDRAGFEAALLKWREAVEAAQAANPMTLEAAKATVGPVFQTCKGCHDTYRIED
jgi:cytochrome c556